MNIKKFAGILTVFCFALSGSAQERGQIWVGGNISFFEGSYDKHEVKSSSYSICPEAGYQFSERWGAGLAVLSKHTKIEAESAVATKTMTYGVTPFARYIAAKGKIGYFYLDGGIGYENDKVTLFNTVGGVGYDTKTHLLSIGIRPGVAVNLSKNVALTGRFGFIGYTYSKWDEQNMTSKETSKESYFSCNFSIEDIEYGFVVKF